uniref:C-type lectin domain-containing protein n=1 Tax=Anopheles farauti TaxID=69004 RepID=A0A182Q9E2_9DIPT
MLIVSFVLNMASRRTISTLFLFVVVPLVSCNIAGLETVEHFLIRNQCTCPCKPSEQKKFLIPSTRTSDWFGAVAFCRSIEMEMAEVLSAAEAQALREVIQEEEADDGGEEYPFYWIGANDLGVLGTYRWALTGRAVQYTNWAEGEPNNGRAEESQLPTERCVAVGAEAHQWNDFQCTLRKRFVCQRFRDE